MKFRLGPMHSDYWPWSKIPYPWNAKGYVRLGRSWFIFRLCQLFPGRTFWGHTYGAEHSPSAERTLSPTKGTGS